MVSIYVRCRYHYMYIIYENCKILCIYIHIYKFQRLRDGIWIESSMKYKDLIACDIPTLSHMEMWRTSKIHVYIYIHTYPCNLKYRKKMCTSLDICSISHCFGYETIYEYIMYNLIICNLYVSCCDVMCLLLLTEAEQWYMKRDLKQKRKEKHYKIMSKGIQAHKTIYFPRWWYSKSSQTRPFEYWHLWWLGGPTF